MGEKYFEKYVNLGLTIQLKVEILLLSAGDTAINQEGETMMKLGTQTGSLVNHIYSRAAASTPMVGEGATLLSWTDRYPATVVEVFTHGKYDYFVVQEDSATRVDDYGMSDAQSYEYSCNPQGRLSTFRVKNGGFEAVRQNENGRWVKSYGSVAVGRREKYHDYSF